MEALPELALTATGTVPAPANWPRRLLAPFSRIQSAGRYIPVIDGLRFYAFAAVIAVHWAKHAALLNAGESGEALNVRFFLNGAFGVQLFYVISGFVLALPFAKAWREKKPRPKLKAYYLRRLTRLEPPYVINLLVFFCSIRWSSIRAVFAARCLSSWRACATRMGSFSATTACRIR
jgi:peptidoglycan/LPS O-acetylase OafA/YrhL